MPFSGQQFGAVAEHGRGALVIPPVVTAAQRVHPVLPASLAHRLRAPVAGREQLTRRGDRGLRRDGRAQQRGQDEQLVEGARAVGQPDAGVLGVQPPVPGEQLPDDRFRLACHARSPAQSFGGAEDMPDKTDVAPLSSARSPTATTPTGVPSRNTGMRRTA